MKMKLYTNDLDQPINENYVPTAEDRVVPHTIVEAEFKAGKMPPKVSELPISSAALVDFYPDEETAKRYNQSYLGIASRADESSSKSFYRFFGDATVDSFKKDMGVKSVEDLVGKEILRLEQSTGSILGYSPKE